LLPIASFAKSVAKDRPAVRATITSVRSGGQAGGQIGKLKLAKWQMYGRAKLDPLEARLIGTSGSKTEPNLRLSPD